MAGVKRPFDAVLGLGQTHSHSGYQGYHRHGTRSGTPKAQRPRVSHLGDSDDATTRTPSPTPKQTMLTTKIPDFGADASIVLVGIRGAGKSTLAIIASSAMKRRVIDVETAFQRACGQSSASYKKNHGLQQYHHHQAKVLRDVLERNRTDCVIVCSWMESQTQVLLAEFASTNPVVHVVREADAIQDHLKIQDRERMQSLLGVSVAICRSCSNFEFFNISERQAVGTERSSLEYLFNRPSPPYLALKMAERHFLKFLSLIYPPDTIPCVESASPLATVAPEDRRFTYALSLPMGDILSPGFVLEDHVEGADAVQIVVGDIASQLQASQSDRFGDLASQMTKAVGVTRRSSVLPLMVHVELPEDTSDELVHLYMDLVSHATRLAAEIVTIDLRLALADLSSLLAMRGRSKVLGEFSITRDPPPWDSSTWTSLYRKATDSGCHMARFIRPAESMDDNFAVTRFRESVTSLGCPRIPLIAYNTGLLGRSSACFNPILTTVVPKSQLDLDSHWPGSHCLTVSSASQALCASFVYDKMRFYVFGMKVGYSASPAMHNSALRSCGLSHHYRPHSTDSLSSVRHLIDDMHFGGASIGLPFKVEVITLIHSLSRHAQAIGAVNTLIPIRQLNPDGSLPEGGQFFNGMGRAGPVKALYGENTDWIGIQDCIRQGLSPANAVRSGTSGLIIGAGGMARAAVYAMLQVGVQNIAVYNRTLSNAEKMAEHFGQLLEKPDFQSLGAGNKTRFEVIRDITEEWPTDFNPPTIIISCIPTHRIGNTPAPDFRLPDKWLANRTGGVIVELGYKSLNTPLLEQAAQEAWRGWVAMTGLDLLPVQGFAQFELFTGKRAPRAVMKQGLIRSYKDSKGHPRTELESGLPSEAEGDA